MEGVRVNDPSVGEPKQTNQFLVRGAKSKETIV